MTDARLLSAASNNAHWCHLISDTHGIPGEFHGGCWLNPQPMPPFYPNMVTFSPLNSPKLNSPNDFGACLARLKADPPAEHWAVKDSFRELELTEQGFDVLFEASWIWRDPSAAETSTPASGIDWITVDSADLLRNWEWGWTAQGDDYLDLFKPALLAAPDVVIVGGVVGERFVAGGIGFVTGDVVGVSNLFTPQDDPLHCWQTVTYLIRERFPGKPMVGYEADDSLVLAQGDGFAPIGPLRIWVYAG